MGNVVLDLFASQEKSLHFKNKILTREFLPSQWTRMEMAIIMRGIMSFTVLQIRILLLLVEPPHNKQMNCLITKVKASLH